MQPLNRISSSLPQPTTGLAAASHHVALDDVLNGYCLNFYTARKVFNT
ncbi:hypothetical protein [Hymenobacter sp. B81]